MTLTSLLFNNRIRTVLKSHIIKKTIALIPQSITRLELFLTENCTLNCDYCFVASKNKGRRMSWEIAKKAVDFLMIQSGDQPEIHITFIGGEPLLEFPLMKRIAHYAEACAERSGKRVNYAVTTNGTIMSDEIVQFAQERGLNYLLSLDGNKESHDLHRKTYNGKGSWEIVMKKNFHLLRTRQGWMGARVTVNPDTVDHLSSNIKMLFDIGINQFIIGPNTDIKWSIGAIENIDDEMNKIADFYFDEKRNSSPIRISDLDENLEDMKSKFEHYWGCDAGRLRVAISTQGDIYPCARFVSTFSDINGLYKLGNLDEGINNISARQEFMDNSDTPRPKCAICSYKDYCSGGCPATNLHMQGSIYKPSELDCHMTRIKVEILDRIAKSRMMSVTKIDDKLP